VIARRSDSDWPPVPELPQWTPIVAWASIRPLLSAQTRQTYYYLDRLTE
jgi:hypothetical protein